MIVRDSVQRLAGQSVHHVQIDLRDAGQVFSLREILDVYLWRGFCMKQSEHVMIESVVPHMSSAYAAEQLQRVRDVAKRTC